MVHDTTTFFVQSRPGHVLVGLIALLVVKYVLDASGRLSRRLLGRERTGPPLVFGDRRVGLTVNTVLLSVVRYIGYFLLFGWILTQFGVRPSQYLASVSFVAIAVGFGTQGLVQDVVTGFFLIFERQLDVGDMVVVSGQTGIVEDFGLRLTRLRLADGGHVILPNRSISQVINYRAGSLQATVDVGFPSDLGPERREAACAALAAASQRVAQQFTGAARGAAQVQPWVDQGACGGYFRLRLPLWPGQTWLVDGQWVPRLQAELTAQGLDPAHCQLAAHYDSPAPPPPPSGLRWLRPRARRADPPAG